MNRSAHAHCIELVAATINKLLNWLRTCTGKVKSKAWLICCWFSCSFPSPFSRCASYAPYHFNHIYSRIRSTCGWMSRRAVYWRMCVCEPTRFVDILIECIAHTYTSTAAILIRIKVKPMRAFSVDVVSMCTLFFIIRLIFRTCVCMCVVLNFLSLAQKSIWLVAIASRTVKGMREWLYFSNREKKSVLFCPFNSYRKILNALYIPFWQERQKKMKGNKMVDSIVPFYSPQSEFFSLCQCIDLFGASDIIYSKLMRISTQMQQSNRNEAKYSKWSERGRKREKATA